MTPLMQWAARWGVSAEAVNDLRRYVLGLDVGHTQPEVGASEAAVQSRVRVKASRLGLRLWRNNVGAVHDVENNVHVRYGLANDSKLVNSMVKSGDLIGIRPRIIQPADVGCLVGQFVSFECKRSDWRYAGTDRELAQERWAQIVTSLGGEARFVTSEDQV